MSWIRQRNPHSQPLCSFSLLHPSILVLSGSLATLHALYWSSAAAFGKINGSTGGQERGATSGGAGGRSVDVSAAARLSLCTKEAEQTRAHSFLPWERGKEALCVCLTHEMTGMWRDSVRALGGPWRYPFIQPRVCFTSFHICKCHTHRRPHTTHINCVPSMSNHTDTHRVLWHMTSSPSRREF